MSLFLIVKVYYENINVKCDGFPPRAKRLGCPMYLRLRLSPDLQKLVLFDINESHNHGIDPNTTQLPPRQQAYKLLKMRNKGGQQPEPTPTSQVDINTLVASAIKDGTVILVY